MKHRHSRLTAAACVAAISLLTSLQARAGLLVSFPFDEGTGSTTIDTVAGAVGWFGYQNPLTDQVLLTDNAPSGAAGDRCITTSGRGFLLVDDSVDPILDITNGPITLEAWVNLDPYVVPKMTEGIVGYGQSFKMGMRGGYQVFTLFGIRDITNSSVAVPSGAWTHLAAAWEPGVGVHFYINGTNHTFVADTAPAARPVWHNLLTIASESPTNGYNTICSLDRVRVHNALLDATQIDSVAAAPKALLASTLVAYDFNEATFPCENAKAPSRPTVGSAEFYVDTAKPTWTNDTPTGLPSDYALAFNMLDPSEKDRVTADSPTLDLRGFDGRTNYTFEAWVKLPPTLNNEREVIFKTFGPAPRITVSVDIKRNLHTTVLGSADYPTSVFIPNDNRWHHIAISMVNKTDLNFFLDGVLRETIAVKPKDGSSENSNGLLIGQESNTRYLRGLMDRVRVWDFPLTAAELDFPAIPGQAVVTTQPADVVADAGSAAQFTAVVSSPSGATYQWHYRPLRFSQTSVPVAGATSTTLDLASVTPEMEGYYFLKITNSAGVTESYAAQLMVRTGPSLDLEGFEAPNYLATQLEGQDLWTVDQIGSSYQVATATEIEAALNKIGLTPGQTVHGGSQALLILGPGAASVGIRPVLGFENQKNVTLEFWARPLTAGNTGMVTNNIFLAMENSAGTRAAAIRFGPSRSIDYNTANVWTSTGLQWNDQTWYKFALEVDYAALTYNLYVNGAKVNANPLPFYHPASDKLQQIRIYRGSNQAGMILDDLSAAALLRISSFEVSGGTVSIHWQGGMPPYQLQRRTSLTTGDWEDVGAATSDTQATDTLGTGGFYRVKGN